MSVDGSYARDEYPHGADVAPEYAEAAERVRPLMDDRRYAHTLSVAREAAKLARLHGQDARKAYLAGLLHDCAKNMPLSDMQRIAAEQGVPRDPDMLDSSVALHSYAGAYLAEHTFHVSDREVLNAIVRHVFGTPDMTDLDKCVFVADGAEPVTRAFDGANYALRIAQTSLNAAVVLLLLLTRRYVRQSGYAYFQAGTLTLDALTARLTPDERALLAPYEHLFALE